ncbi:MAG: hypothetical protein RLZ37_1652, partial [Actinomycetota bacterium]
MGTQPTSRWAFPRAGKKHPRIALQWSHESFHGWLSLANPRGSRGHSKLTSQGMGVVSSGVVVVEASCSELVGTFVTTEVDETAVVDVGSGDGVVAGAVDVGAGGSESVGGLHVLGPGGAGTATRRATTEMNT